MGISRGHRDPPIVFGIDGHTHMNVVGQFGEPRGQHGAGGLAHARNFIETR